MSRSFGNKTTWDKPFEEHFQAFLTEINHLIFDNGLPNRSLNLDVLDLEGNYDLVYLDPPYISASGNTVNYLEFYHFLEGLVNYEKWGEWIDYSTKNKRLRLKPNLWNNPSRVGFGFRTMFEKFRHSILVVSYRSDASISIEQLVKMMKQFKRHVSVCYFQNYRYVLSPKRVTEVLIIGE